MSSPDRFSSGARDAAGTVTLHIPDVPDALRDRLATVAEERGQSLQAYLFGMITDEVRRRDSPAFPQREPEADW